MMNWISPSRRRTALAGLAVLTAVGALAAAPPPGLNPAWKIVDIRPAALRPLVTGIDFLSDGRLVVAHWGGLHNDVHLLQKKGAIYIMDKVTGDNPTPTYSTFAQNLEDPVGMMVKDDKIYVTGGEKLIELPDANNDGKAEAAKIIAQIPGTHARHEFLFGLAFKDGKFWMSPSSGKDVAAGATSWAQLNPNRGTTMSVDPTTGQWEIFAMGLREPNGIGVGPDNELFVPDVQGNWLPSNKLINIKKGRFYGFKHDPAESWDNMRESPPAVFLPQGDVALAPGQPLYIPTGALPGDRFAGQMLIGDAVAGGIRRIFLEKVNGEYQGAAFFLTGGLEAGPNRMVWGPDGYLYVGMCGQGSGWSYLQDFGLQKIKLSGQESLDMVAVRSRQGGMEIEYSHEINAAGQNASSYTLRSWHYTPTSAYGGAAQQTKNLSLGQAQVSSDKKKVFLPVNGLEAGKVIHIRVSPSVQSATGGLGLWNAEAYYTLNSISTSPPFEPTVALAEPRAVQHRGAMEVTAAPGRLSLTAPLAGLGEVTVRDARGALVSRAQGQGRESLEVSTQGWNGGLYFVTARSGAKTLTRTVALP